MTGTDLPIRSVAVFCGSGLGARPAYADAARDFGILLARNGIRLIFGGGKIGLMGAVADAALAAGGDVVGVMPQRLVDKEIAHAGLSELVVCETMHERKAAMAEASDAFVALPGGAGTLEEIFEVWTWQQIGYHAKPCAFYEVEGYWAPLLGALEHFRAEGFMRAPYLESLVVEDSAEAMLEALQTWRSPDAGWLRPA